ncbi:MAG: FecR domain-containing protein [Phaeodactylibacter sp.]|nr:FecR domain-containing protein [Phaeodactylibacter sp.]
MDKNNDIEAIIIRSLEGQANAEEERSLRDWLREEAHRRQYDQVKNLWDAAAGVDFGLDPETDRRWESLEGQLPGGAGARPGRVIRFQHWRFAAAAVLLAGLLGLIAFYFTGRGGPAIAREYASPAGEQQEVQLPDGTLVALNAASRLQVLRGFGEEERRIRLEGEGYFQVSSDAGRPFIIEAGSARVQVTGTAFNLKAYPESSAVRLTVTEGSVRFSSAKKEAARPVAAGEAAEMDKASGAIRSLPYDERAAAWQQGVLFFDDTPWPEVVRCLERFFAVKISDQTALQEKRYTAAFDNQSLEECLKVMQATFGFSVESKGERVVLK